jgi:preprotein translocase subunit YajC
MTPQDAKKLKVGQRVQWADGTLGTVRETSYAAVKIEWADGQWALMPFANREAPWKNVRRATAPGGEK